MTATAGLAGYHSTFNDYPVKETACGCPLLPLRDVKSGRAAAVLTDRERDIVDEAVYCFKANALLQLYAVTGPADRILTWLTLYIHQILIRIRGKNRDEASKALFNLSREAFPAPGDSNFVLGGLFATPKSDAEKDAWITYFKVLREETNTRVLEKVFAHPESDGTPSKFWMQFLWHSFMNKAFETVDVTGKMGGR